MEFNIRRDRKGRLSISTLKEVAGFGVASLPCLYRNNSIEIGQQITLKRLHGWLHSYLRSCEKVPPDWPGMWSIFVRNMASKKWAF